MIGASFRVERRVQFDDPTAKAGHHLGHYTIGPDAQPLASDLHRQVPVAEMPGNPQQI